MKNQNVHMERESHDAKTAEDCQHGKIMHAKTVEEALFASMVR